MGTLVRRPAIPVVLLEASIEAADDERYWEIARGLVLHETVSVADLEAALDDRRPDVRITAALALMWADAPPGRAFATLVAAADERGLDTNFFDYEIGHVSDWAESHLIAALRSNDVQLRRRAAACFVPLTRAHGGRDLDALLGALADPDEAVRSSAVDAMTYMGEALDARIGQVVGALLQARTTCPALATAVFPLIASRLGALRRPAAAGIEASIAAAVTAMIEALVPGAALAPIAARALTQMILDAPERAAARAAVEPCIAAAPNQWHRDHCAGLRDTLTAHSPFAEALARFGRVELVELDDWMAAASELIRADTATLLDATGRAPRALSRLVREAIERRSAPLAAEVLERACRELPPAVIFGLIGGELYWLLRAPASWAAVRAGAEAGGRSDALRERVAIHFRSRVASLDRPRSTVLEELASLDGALLDAARAAVLAGANERAAYQPDEDVEALLADLDER